MSVRRRVIKILKDICVLQPQFPRTNEICVKIMRRIGDEEGIKVRGGRGVLMWHVAVGLLPVCPECWLGVPPQQLVTSVFKELWFTLPPAGADQKEALERRVTQITAVVSPPLPSHLSPPLLPPTSSLPPPLPPLPSPLPSHHG